MYNDSMWWSSVVEKVCGRELDRVPSAFLLGLIDLNLLGGHTTLLNLLKGHALGLGDEEGGQETEGHDTGKDSEQLGQEGVLAGLTTDLSDLVEEEGGQDGTELARGGRDTVGGGADTGGEDLTGDDEGGSVGSEVEEELGQGEDGDEEGDDGLELVEGEREDQEEDGQHGETHELDLLAAHLLDEEDGEPVTGNETEEGDSQVAEGSSPEVIIDLTVADETHGVQDVGLVERDTIESNIEQEPGRGGTDEDLEVLPAREVLNESTVVVTVGLGLGDGSLVGDGISSSGGGGGSGGGGTGNGGVGLLDIVLDIHGVTGGLGHGQAEVDGGNSRDTTNTNADTPDVIEVVNIGLDGCLEAGEDDEGHDRGHHITDTLHGEDDGHELTATTGRGPLGGDSGRHGVITTDTDTEDEAPEGEVLDDSGALSVGSGHGAAESTENDDHQLQTVDLLTTVGVTEVTKDELTDEGSE